MSAADTPAQVDPLDRFFAGLKNKNPEVRVQSAQDLRKHVCAMLVDVCSLAVFSYS